MAVTLTVAPRYVDVANSNSLKNGGSYSQSISNNASEEAWGGVYANDVAGLSSACKITSISYSFSYRADTDSWKSLRSVAYSTRPVTILDGSTIGNLNNDYTHVANKYCDAAESTTSTLTYSQLSTGVSSNVAFGVRFKCESEQLTSFSRTYYIRNLKVGYTRTRACYVYFSDHGVTTQRVLYDYGDTVSMPQPTPQAGYEFAGWRSNLDHNLYDVVPVAGEVDVIYTAEYRQIQYSIHAEARVNDTSTILVNATLTGSGNYVINSTFSITADTTPFAESVTQSYAFDYWTFESGGSPLFNGQHYSNADLANLTLDAANIAAWFAGSTSMTAVAHFRQVYIVTINGSGHHSLGLNRVTVQYTGADEVITQNLTLGSPITAYSNTMTVRVYLNNTTQFPDDYSIDSVAASGFTYTGFTDSTNPTPTRNGVAVGQPLNYTMQATSSTGTFTIGVLKQYFSLTLSGNTDNAVKVYRNGMRIMPSDLGHILRGMPVITVNATEAATQDTRYNAVLKYNSSPVSGNVYTINDLSQDYTFAVETSVVNYTMTRNIIDVNGQTTTVTQSISRTDPVVDAQSNVFFAASAGTGETILSAVVINTNNETVYSASNIATFSYPVLYATQPLTLTVTLVGVPSEYVYLRAGTCNHGSIQADNWTLLKSDFSYFQYGGTTPDSNYEIMSVTYQWFVDDGNGNENAFGSVMTMPSNGRITYPANWVALTGGQIGICYINVTFRKNLLYFSAIQNGERDIRRPQELYYNTTETGTNSVVAVFVQTKNKPTSTLLWGDEGDWIVSHTVNSSLSYTVDLSNGTLYIQCFGALPVYATSAEIPWNDYKDSISTVEFLDGCTSLALGTFDSLLYLQKIVLPEETTITDYPRVFMTNGCLVIYCRGDDTDNFEFAIEDERLVVSYGG